MKKISAIILIAVSVLLTQCRDRSFPFQTYFWTSSEPGTTNYLFVNDTNRGILPYLSAAPTCKDDQSKKQALYLSLASGTYKIAVIDKEGKVKFKQEITVRLSTHGKEISTSTDDHRGGSHNVNEGDCLIEELYY